MPTPDEGPSPFAPTLASAIQLRPGDDLAAAIAHAPASAVVELVAGEYVLAGPIVVDRPLTLLGAGLLATRVVTAAGGAVLRVAGADARVEGITFAYARPAGTHLPWRHWSDVLVVERGHLRLTDCACEGAHGQRWLPFMPYFEILSLRGGRGVWVGRKGRLTGRGCRFQENGVYGVSTCEPDGLDLADCVLAGNEDSGVGTFGEGGGRVAGCLLERNGFHGVAHKGRQALALADNTVRDNGLDGLHFGEQATGEARANRCSGNGRDGIRVDHRATPTLIGNTVSANRLGLTFRDRAGGMAEANVVELNSQDGIAVFDRAAPALLRNEIHENGGPGLAYHGKAGGRARQNALRDNGEPAVSRPRGCKADVDAATLGLADELAARWQALRALLPPDAPPAEVAAALAALWPYAPRGEELEAWLLEGFTPPPP